MDTRTPLLSLLSAVVLPAAFASPASVPLVTAPVATSVIDCLRDHGNHFTPEVKQAFLDHAKATAQRDLAAAGKPLPADFLAWVDGDPVVAATVYGARRNAANVLLMLRSLELDLGTRAVRKDYTQLALAMAVVHAAKGPDANLAARPLLALTIPGDPRKPVDTTDAKRTLDLNDHIINFLNSNSLVEDVVIGHKEEPPPLKYDAQGKAIPPAKNAKPVKTPITEKRKRTLYAADVIAGKHWQEKFNAYMKAHGQNVSIDCGDMIVSWNSKAAVGAQRKKINEAFVMFRTAYEAKGLLPAARDASPSPAESAAYLIRNDRFVFPEATRAQRNWPRYPLTAPWPTLTLLAADNQPLREREERWIAFRDKGEMRTYGEYIGAIAQQSDMQSARRIKPFPFHYGTYQMMAKDGGVCGTMANMGVRTYNSLGIPACTAGQPGHCALILFAFDPKTNTCECRGGQFATGGPDKTSPHGLWFFGDVDARKPMIYHQTPAWAVNFGFQSFVDSLLAYQLFQGLPETARKEQGLPLLESALALNPYNFLLTDAAQSFAATPQDQVRFWKTFHTTLAAVSKPGCPKDGLYPNTVRSNLFARLAKLPVPSDLAEARKLLAFMLEEKCANPELIVSYQVALDGLEVVVNQTQTAFQNHLASARTDESCRIMAATLTAIAHRIPDKKLRSKWLLDRCQELAGDENYFGPKDKILTDACLPALAKLSHSKPPEPAACLQPLLDQVATRFKAQIQGRRDLKSCKEFAVRITAIARQIKDPAQSRRWLEGLSQTIAGHEDFQVLKGKKQTDPCAATIAGLLAASPPD